MILIGMTDMQIGTLCFRCKLALLFKYFWASHLHVLMRNKENLMN
jgi:hypothetical protein